MRSNPTPLIVIFGLDPALLESRRWLVEHAGFKVAASSDLAGTEQLIQAESFKVLILCHSLSPELCRETVALAHKARPHTRILIMSAGTETCAASDQDETISSFEGPRALIAAVKRLLGSPLAAS